MRVKSEFSDEKNDLRLFPVLKSRAIRGTGEDAEASAKTFLAAVVALINESTQVVRTKMGRCTKV